MINESNQYKLVSCFLEDPKNKNIKWFKINGKDKPDGICIDADSLTKEQANFIKNLPKH